MTRRSRNDLSIYDLHAGDWKDSDSRAFRSLHSIQAWRLQGLLARMGRSSLGTVVDVGCGGGILAEPLASHADELLALDRSERSLDAFTGRSDRVKRIRADARRLPLRDASADLVLLADVLEHVEDWPVVIEEAARVVKPGGHVYVSTINRGRRATLVAVHLAESLGYVPRGTHDPALFVRPGELIATCEECGLREPDMAGERPRLLSTIRQRRIVLTSSKSLAVSYSALFRKVST